MSGSGRAGRCLSMSAPRRDHPDAAAAAASSRNTWRTATALEPAAGAELNYEERGLRRRRTAASA